MKYEYDRSFKLKIQDDWWEFYLITDEEGHELDMKLNDENDGFRAITLTGRDGQCMFFVEGSVTKSVVTHELFHLYVSYLHIGSATIDLDNFEEMIAEFLELHLDKFVKMRNRIYNKLKKLEGSGRKKK